MATKTLSTTTSTYTFDALDRLLQFSSNTSGVVSTSGPTTFTYNGDGVRVAKNTIELSSTTYLQDLASPLPVVLVETTGSEETRYLYGKNLVSQIHSIGSREYIHADAIGSTRALSDASGAAVASYTYDAFGAVRSHSASASSSFTFTGEQTDSESSLEFLRARYYDPATGRFVSKDPASGVAVLPQMINRLVYATNNPTSAIDHSGKLLEWVIRPLGSVANVLSFKDAADDVVRTYQSSKQTAELTDQLGSGLDSNPQTEDLRAGPRRRTSEYRRNHSFVGSSGELLYTGYVDVYSSAALGSPPKVGYLNSSDSTAALATYGLNHLEDADSVSSRLGRLWSIPGDWLVDQLVQWFGGVTVSQNVNVADSRKWSYEDRSAPRPAAPSAPK